MKNLKNVKNMKALSLILAATLLFAAGCSADTNTDTIKLSVSDDNPNGIVTVVKSSSTSSTVSVTKTVTEADIATAVKVSDGETITKAGTYILEGEYTHTVTIDADKEDDVILILNGATITSEDGPAISAVKCNSLVISLTEGTVNTLTDASEYADTSDSAPTGALFSKNDLTIEGEGTLVVTGNKKHAIVSKDNLYINGGIIEVSAVKDGLHAGDSLTVNAGTVTVKESNEGMESEIITVNGGTVSVNAKDDGINATSDEIAPVITFNGGTVTVNSSGDGIDSNGNIELNGGLVYVSGATNDGNAAVDYDGTFIANGGTLISSGMSGMYQSVSKDSKNYVIDYISDSEIAAGTKVSLSDGKTVIAEFEVLKNANAILITSDALESGKEYTLKLGNETVTVTAGESSYQGFGGFGGFGGPGGNFKPGDFNGERPEGSDGELPEGFDGEFPEGFDGMTPPEGFDGTTPPDGFNGDGPKGGFGPGGRGEKPGNNSGSSSGSAPGNS
ncbi:MAG: carbohydrate-binding domain-containing protein [Lachnospiraceae bacterium]|nr:carbohydrate-binding domain-containing protein [Lachnospiraceae bacterium]